MKEHLWNFYMTLQTNRAYGEKVAAGAASEKQVYTSVEYINRIREARGLSRPLVIGPGGMAEVGTLLATFPQSTLHVLTAHGPEADQIKLHGGGQVIVHAGDIHDMPYQHEVFDFLYANNVLEHCFAPYIALLESRRVLVQGALAYFILPSFGGREGGVGPFHLHCLTEEVWVELMKKTGFTLADKWEIQGNEDAGCNYTHYICTATAPAHPHDLMLRDLTSHKVIMQGR